MTVTRRDMDLIAAKLRQCLETLRSDSAQARVAATQCVVAVSSALAESNPRFDRHRFAKAALPEGWGTVESYGKTPADIIRRIRETERQLEELRDELEAATLNSGLIRSSEAHK